LLYVIFASQFTEPACSGRVSVSRIRRTSTSRRSEPEKANPEPHSYDLRKEHENHATEQRKGIDTELLGVVSIGDLMKWIISAQEETIHHLEHCKYPG
jgi:hypothetical protein